MAYVGKIDVGTLVKWRDDTMGIVIETHKPNGCSSFAYRIKWFDGSSGVLADWQFEVVSLITAQQEV